MRYQSDHKQKSRERVLANAADAIRAVGPHQISVAGVMEAAGLTHGAFYSHFASKEALISDTIEAMLDERLEALNRAMAVKPASQALSAYIDHYLSIAHRDTRTMGCPLPYLSADIPRLGTAAQERFSIGLQRLTASLRRAIGDLGVPDAEEVASSVLAEMVGAMVLARSDLDPRRSSSILRRSREALKQRLGIGSTAIT